MVLSLHHESIGFWEKDPAKEVGIGSRRKEKRREMGKSSCKVLLLVIKGIFVYFLHGQLAFKSNSKFKPNITRNMLSREFLRHRFPQTSRIKRHFFKFCFFSKNRTSWAAWHHPWHHRLSHPIFSLASCQRNILVAPNDKQLRWRKRACSTCYSLERKHKKFISRSDYGFWTLLFGRIGDIASNKELGSKTPIVTLFGQIRTCF